MKCYGLGAVGFTMLITCIGIQWYLFAENFFHQMVHSNTIREWENVGIDIYSMMNSLFGVSAVLISFGALIGKIKPFQLVILTFLELTFHAFNFEVILVGGIQIADVGGTYADHMFGAYFGLAVAYVLRKQRLRVEPAMGYVPDIFSLIGTLFLWVYWPSFVGGAAQADSAQQARAIMNTILALSASTIMTFFLSSVMAKEIKFRPVDIQNATLAGGVAIGCVANFNMNPVNAIFIGSAAGLWSTFGFNVIQPYLFEHWGLHDTCGVHNLHAMPSVIGGIASVILAAYKQTGGRQHDQDVFPRSSGQAWRQLVAIGACIAWAVVAGYLTGLFLKWLEPNSPDDFDDNHYWETTNDYVYMNSENVHLYAPHHHREDEEEGTTTRSRLPDPLNPLATDKKTDVQVFDLSSSHHSNSAAANRSNHSKMNISNHASPRLNQSNHSRSGGANTSFHGSKHGYEMVKQTKESTIHI
jgi:ammonium transporter Rh